MIAWLSANIGTILVGLVVLAIVIGIVLSLHRDKKQGKLSCGGNCSSCSHCSGHCGGCH